MPTIQQTDRLVETLKDRIYYSLARIEDSGDVDKVHFTELRIKPDSSASGTILLIFKGEWDGLPVVGFHQDQGLVTAIAQGLSRAMRGNLKWRIDRYAMENAGYDNDSITAAERELEGLQGGSA